MASEGNEVLMSRVVEEVIHEHSAEAANGALGTDHRLDAFGVPESMRELGDWKQISDVYFTVFPEMRDVIEEMITAGYVVSSGITWTDQGDLMDLRATGRQAEGRGMRLNRIVDARLAEYRGVDDTPRLRQLRTPPSE